MNWGLWKQQEKHEIILRPTFNQLPNMGKNQVISRIYLQNLNQVIGRIYLQNLSARLPQRIELVHPPLPGLWRLLTHSPCSGGPRLFCRSIHLALKIRKQITPDRKTPRLPVEDLPSSTIQGFSPPVKPSQVSLLFFLPKSWSPSFTGCARVKVPAASSLGMRSSRLWRAAVFALE